MTKNEKISVSLKAHYKEFGFPPREYKSGWKQTPESTAKRAASLQETINRKGRVSEEHKKARNKANVYAWRARRMNAIPADADLELIKLIYLHCPEGYHVDHRIALASGGLHHQDNLQYLPIAENCRKGKRGVYDESLAIQWIDVVSIAPHPGIEPS